MIAPTLPGMTEAFAPLCRQAAERGTNVLFEMLPAQFSRAPSLDQVLAITRGSGAGNGGIMLDNLHLQRIGIDSGEIVRNLKASDLIGVEINDGTLAMPLKFEEFRGRNACARRWRVDMPLLQRSGQEGIIDAPIASRSEANTPQVESSNFQRHRESAVVDLDPNQVAGLKVADDLAGVDADALQVQIIEHDAAIARTRSTRDRQNLIERRRARELCRQHLEQDVGTALGGLTHSGANASVIRATSAQSLPRSAILICRARNTSAASSSSARISSDAALRASVQYQSSSHSTSTLMMPFASRMCFISLKLYFFRISTISACQKSHAGESGARCNLDAGPKVMQAALVAERIRTHCEGPKGPDKFKWLGHGVVRFG